MQFKVRIAPDKEGDYVVSCPALKLSAPVSGDFEQMIDAAVDAVRDIVVAETRSPAITVGVGAVSLSFTVGAAASKNRSLAEYGPAVEEAAEGLRGTLREHGGTMEVSVGSEPAFADRVLEEDD